MLWAATDYHDYRHPELKEKSRERGRKRREEL
jgi:hypothetical protein